jgi:uncharacterized protein DUF6602
MLIDVGHTSAKGTMEDLKQIIRADARDLENQFNSASIQGRGTPQEISDFRENALQEFLANYFPYPYRIAKGNIIDHTNRRSASIDCIVVNPEHPYTIDRRKKFKVILADGVDAAIEFKPDISQIGELERGLVQGLSVKALRRANSPLLLKDRRPQKVVERSLRVPFFIFARKAKKNIRDTAAEVLAFYERQGTERLDQADAIIVNGVGIIANFPIEGSLYWSVEDEDSNGIGWFIENWGEDTLAGLLFKINNSFASRATVQEPILTRYLRTMKIIGLERLDPPVQG